jgi:hypothetical protein
LAFSFTYPGFLTYVENSGFEDKDHNPILLIDRNLRGSSCTGPYCGSSVVSSYTSKNNITWEYLGGLRYLNAPCSNQGLGCRHVYRTNRDEISPGSIDFEDYYIVFDDSLFSDSNLRTKVLDSFKFGSFDSFRIDKQDQTMTTYSSGMYKISLQYPSGWIVKKVDPYIQDSNIARILFFSNVQDSKGDIQKAALTLSVIKNGDLKFGTRDWQDLTLGTNKFTMSCENGPMGGFSTSCEIVPVTNGGIAYVIYANNPNTDAVSKEMLTNLQIK